MPTVTIRYTLPDEQGDFDAARLGRAALSRLWDIDQHCRALLKHGDPSEEVEQLASQIRELIPQEMMDV